VCGDTLAKCKPHPEPIWHACRLLNVLEDNCVYIGDAERDIQAGNRAGLYTIAVRYGYIPAIEDPQNWHADEILNKPSDILTWLKHKLNV
jgi:phosphoglycolate phosphatase